MDHSLKRLERKLVCRGKILDMYLDVMQLPDGSREEWDFISYKAGGGACVVPVMRDGRILMVRQYRPAISRVTLELPAGTRNRLPDGTLEDSLITAKRELAEETGCSSEKMTQLLSLRSAVAYCNEMTDVYLAEGVEYAGEQQLDEAEDIKTTAMETETLRKMIFSGEIQDAKTAAGILAYIARSE